MVVLYLRLFNTHCGYYINESLNEWLTRRAEKMMSTAQETTSSWSSLRSISAPMRPNSTGSMTAHKPENTSSTGLCKDKELYCTSEHRELAFILLLLKTVTMCQLTTPSRLCRTFHQQRLGVQHVQANKPMYLLTHMY